MGLLGRKTSKEELECRSVCHRTSAFSQLLQVREKEAKVILVIGVAVGSQQKETLLPISQVEVHQAVKVRRHRDSLF